MLETDADT